MSNREDFYSKEALLVNNAKRELVNGIEKDPIYKLRLMCFAKGATGILDLAKSLRSVERNGKNALSLTEFTDCVQKSGLDCNQDDMKALFNNFDVAQNGCLNTNEFLNKLRPTMTHTRLSIINKAFEKIDNDNDGIITAKEIKNVYCVRDHPKYLRGDLTEKEILEQFLNNFGGGLAGEKTESKVTKEDYINYYATVSASIDSDAYFDLVMRRAYKL